jgi:prepilin-type N-terminal cleavage/methylation domain-containing protein
MKTFFTTITKFPHRAQRGFTLIETVVAILILSLTVGALLTLTANGIFSVRYARNQIVANNLAQEALEYIRNTRDTARQQVPQISWDAWLMTLNVGIGGEQHALSTPRGCFQTGANQGCIIDPYTSDATIWEQTYSGSCTSGATGCPYIWFYPGTGFYTYPSRDHPDALEGGTAPVRTSYIRRINAVLSTDPNQLTVTATITWNNGNTPKTLTQSMILTNWGQ